MAATSHRNPPRLATGRGLHDPDGLPRVRRHARMGLDDPRSRRGGGGGKTGFGFTYADAATARLIQDRLAALVVGRDAMAVTKSWNAMVAAIRNLGRPGICSMAIAAVDTALWDLKAKLLDLPLVTLLGATHEAMEAGIAAVREYAAWQNKFVKIAGVFCIDGNRTFVCSVISK